MRVAVLNLVATPYREPVYLELSRTPGLRLRVFYIQSRDSLRGWTGIRPAYDAVQLPCLTPEGMYSYPFIGAINPGLLGHLRRFAPDCLVVHGYSYFTQIIAMRWAMRRRVPFLLWGDSNACQLRYGGMRLVLKDALLRHFCRHAAGVLSIGASNEDFWRHYGVGTDRLFRSPLAVDNAFFASQSAKWRPRRASERARLSLPPGPLALFAGRLAPAKNLLTLLRALALCRRAGGEALSLVLVGDGPERDRLDRAIRDLALTGVFRFGFLPQQELAKFYAIADFFVLPSVDEPWGLVVNEAMAAGLPVLLSRSTGCRPDLLEEGWNGFCFDERDPQDLAAAMLRMSRLSQPELETMGARSAQRISRWSYPEALAGIYRALEAVCPAWRAGAPQPAGVS